ncbi:RNA-directed DNA polymerase, eukaryota, nucleotide-binding alpha-beta plait domain protein [Tanacetum coccineum]
MMHSFRSNADHTRLISKSIFITNFPDSTTSKDLWNLCQPYGTVVDVFIPNRKSKSGKRFAFIRFIKVDNIDRLVGNLCTLWIGRFHLHANVVRFDRPPKYASRSSHPVNPKPANHVSPVATSFVSAVKGGLWVVIELESAKTKLNLMNHVGVASEGVPLHAWSRSTFFKIGSKWGDVLELEDDHDDLFARKRLCIKTKHEENILESFKIIVKGKVFCVCAKELFVWNPTFKDIPEAVHCSDDESIKDIAVDQGDETTQGTKSFNAMEFHMDKSTNIIIERRYSDVAVVSIKSKRTEGRNIGVKPKEGGSILEILDEMIKVGQTMGFSMEGCTKDMENIIGSKGVYEILR